MTTSYPKLFNGIANLQDTSGQAPPAVVSDGNASTGAGLRLPYRKPQLNLLGSVQNITAGLTGSGTDADGMAMDMTMSDQNTKQDITRIGTHPLGFGMYVFNYKPEHRQQVASGHSGCETAFQHFGVMAQEVQSLVPAAVTTGSSGYLQVDYARLGISRCG